MNPEDLSRLQPPARDLPLEVRALVLLARVAGAMFFPLFALMMAQAAWKMAAPVILGMRNGVPSAKAKEPGLVDPATRERLAPTDSIPPGVEVGFDGTWTLDSPTRLVRPAIITCLAGLPLLLLSRALFEMGSQL